MATRSLLLTSLLFSLVLPSCKGGVKSAPDGSEIEAGLTFLNAMAKSAHKDEAEVAAAWKDLRSLSDGKVAIKVSGQTLALDPAGKTSEARLLRYAKVTSLREGAQVKGVQLESLELRVGQQSHRGRGKVLMDDKGGRWVVAALELE